jgi:hypothetical protein
MRILTEALIRGEMMTMELSEQDFCPECCGTLELAGAGERRYLKCTSCYTVFRPKQREENECRS